MKYNTSYIYLILISYTTKHITLHYKVYSYHEFIVSFKFDITHIKPYALIISLQESII